MNIDQYVDIELLADRTTVEMNPTKIEFLYRIGKYQNKNGKARPVLNGLYSFSKKQLGLKSKSQISLYGISKDFPKDVSDAKNKCLHPTNAKVH